MTMFAGNALRVELHAFDGKFAMANALDRAVLGSRRDDEGVRQVHFADRQRVVAGHGEWRGEASEDTLSVMADPRGFSVHHLRRSLDRAAERLAYRLVAEADAEQWKPGGSAAFDQREADAPVLGPPRPGRDQDPVGPTVQCLVDGQ
jgi:hypothetical protein